ncbi:MAG TPA: flagellar biosynthesis regulator FlaF [Parvularculaceae bacterium]|nr:flagellar biosynthesis regulator FlaF [Parvularculaceae bacterium]
MYEQALAADVYRQSADSVATAKSAEYQVFARVTARLVAIRGKRRPFGKYAEALYDNVRMWTALAADVSTAGNKLPPELRSKIFYLFEFTRAHSEKVLHGGASIDALIDINTLVMRGLRGTAPQTEAA